MGIQRSSRRCCWCPPKIIHWTQSLCTETSVFLHHGTKPSDYGILKPERSSDNSLDTRKKYSPYASPPIIDKLFLLVLIRKLNYGTLLPIANIHLNLITIKTGFPKLDI